jgi:sugar lactone lactonase YvrE
VGPDGIYVTDTGIKFDSAGGMTHPGENKIFKVKGRTVSVVAKGDSLYSPNGLTWDMPNLRWVFAPFGGPCLQVWKPASGYADPTCLSQGPGQYDGLEILADGRILVTSWADSAVHVVKDGLMSVMIPNVAAPADIAVDTKRNVVAVPRFNDGKVEYYKIK